MKPLTYEEWIELNPDVLLEERDCARCGGTGYMDCPHCGNDMDCEEGDGRGYVNDAKKKYEEQLSRDVKLAKRYAPKLLPAGVMQ